MKQVILMLITLCTIIAYHAGKIFFAVLGFSHFILPIIITAIVIVACGLLHHADSKNETP